MLRILATLTLAIVLTGCAARGALFKDTSTLSPLVPDQARLFIYRDAISGGIRSDMVRPDLLVNGAPIGEMQAGAVIVLTVPAGSYQVEMVPPPGGAMWSGYRPIGEGPRVELAAGSEAYLKVMITRLAAGGSDFAVRVAPPGQGRKEIQERVMQERKLLPAP
jgi:hypothetical protein